MRLEDYGYLATGRTSSFFEADISSRDAHLRAAIGGSRILVIGGAGSIGSSTVRALTRFAPRSLHVVDISENNLVELVRDLRGSAGGLAVPDFRTLPLDYGSPVMSRLLSAEGPYDYVLNFAALKHVRSEKDVFSLLQMIETNIVKQARLLGWLSETHGSLRYFSVSTDKAANPVNLMGATKRFMEHVMFSDEIARSPSSTVSSARFANVAFSDGSLLYGWIQRLAKNQPIPVPESTKRFFISLEEAGHICVLASVLGMRGDIVIPNLDPADDLVELAPIAVRFIEANGLKPREYRDEREAVANVEEDRSRGFYPLLITPLDTSGEKPYEEFVGDGETSADIGFRTVQAVRYSPAPANTVRRFLAFAESAISDPNLPLTPSETEGGEGGVTSALVSKEVIVDQLRAAIPQFEHAETGKSLDGRL